MEDQNRRRVMGRRQAEVDTTTLTPLKRRLLGLGMGTAMLAMAAFIAVDTALGVRRWYVGAPNRLVVVHRVWGMAPPTCLALFSLGLLFILINPTRGPTRRDGRLLLIALVMLPFIIILPPILSVVTGAWLIRNGYVECPRHWHGLVDVETTWARPPTQCPSDARDTSHDDAGR